MPWYQRTQVVLRAGTPYVDPAASGPAVAIVVNDQPSIIDYGPGLCAVPLPQPTA